MADWRSNGNGRYIDIYNIHDNIVYRKDSHNGCYSKKGKPTLLDEIVKRLEDKSDEPKSPTIQYCSIELYKVSDSYDSEQIIQSIKKNCLPPKTAYVIALHDRDIYTEDTFNSYKELIGTKGQKKTIHYHVLLKLPYRMYRCDIANKLGIEERWILKLKKEQDFDNMIWYVTHEKYEDIQSTL